MPAIDGTYTTDELIQAAWPVTIDDESVPRQAQVRSFAKMAVSNINRILSQNYVLPVTQVDHPREYVYIQSGNTMGALAMMQDVVNANQTLEQNTPNIWQARYEEFLQQIGRSDALPAVKSISIT